MFESNLDPDRPHCPFYGFSSPTDNLCMDTQGNVCAIDAGNRPCKLALSGKKPVWETCFLHTEENLIRLKEWDSVYFLPHELGFDSDEHLGLRLSEWMNEFT